MEDAYYSMIYFPAAASLNLLKMHLYSGKNHLYASQGKAVANVYGKMAEDCIEKDQILANEMGNFNQGKWNGMQLASHIGFTNWNDEDYAQRKVPEEQTQAILCGQDSLPSQDALA